MLHKSYIHLSILLLTLCALPGCWNMCDGPRAQEEQDAYGDQFKIAQAKHDKQDAQEGAEKSEPKTAAAQPQTAKAAKTYGKAVAITTAARLNEILKEGNGVIIDWWAPWCGPCKFMKPIFEELAEIHKHVRFVTINTDELQDKGLMKEYGIDAFPTFTFVANGKVVDKQEGGSSKEAFDAKVARLFKPAGNP